CTKRSRGKLTLFQETSTLKLAAPMRDSIQESGKFIKRREELASSSAHIQSEFTNPNLEVLFSEKQIRDRINEIGAEITRDYAGRNPLLIGVLKGACFFLSDLLRAIDTRLSIEFMAISSYGSSTRTSGEVRILKDLDVAVEGRDIIVVEDIVDTGLTLSYLLANLKSRGAASVKLVALLDKAERREREVKIDYLGFQIPDHFVVGYGVDFAERYRNLPFIAVLKNPETAQLGLPISKQS